MWIYIEAVMLLVKRLTALSHYRVDRTSLKLLIVCYNTTDAQAMADTLKVNSSYIQATIKKINMQLPNLCY